MTATSKTQISQKNESGLITKDALHISKKVPDFTASPVRGIISINDPHFDLTGPGSRVDDYWETTKSKFDKIVENVCLRKFLLIIPGDLFYKSNVNQVVLNYLMAKFWEVSDRTGLKPLIIAGNHDMKGTVLSSTDCLWTIKVSRAANVLSKPDFFGKYSIENEQGDYNHVIIGGTPYGFALPKSVKPLDEDTSLTCLWLTHHNINFATAKATESKIHSMEIDGVDEVFNGHIHHPAPSIKRGQTNYHNIGSLGRTKISEKDRLPVVGIWTPKSDTRIGKITTTELKTPEILSAFTQASNKGFFVEALKKEANIKRREFVNFFKDNSGEKIDIEEQIEAMKTSKKISKNTAKILHTLSEKAKYKLSH